MPSTGSNNVKNKRLWKLQVLGQRVGVDRGIRAKDFIVLLISLALILYFRVGGYRI